jgi:hypothetical protein
MKRQFLSYKTTKGYFSEKGHCVSYFFLLTNSLELKDRFLIEAELCHHCNDTIFFLGLY